MFPEVNFVVFFLFVWFYLSNLVYLPIYGKNTNLSASATENLIVE